jgi:flagellar assembly factor FliW
VNSRTGAGAAQDQLVSPSNLAEREFFFPAGLLGFPACRRYQLGRFKPGGDADSPFFLLSAVDQDLSFPLVQPGTLALDYRFPAGSDLLRLVGAKSPEELVPLLIVTVRERLEQTTLNLQGPVIVNPVSCLGVQLVLENYPLRHPLFTSVGP